MKIEEEKDFELVKEESDKKKNYIFKKDNITKTGFYIIAVILIILTATTIYYGLQTME